MFGKIELERLRLQKDLLVLQSQANRLLLVNELQRVRSPEAWMDEARGLVRRHPVLAALVTTATGALAVQAFRKPANMMGGIGRLGKIASTAFSFWRMLRRGNRAE